MHIRKKAKPLPNDMLKRKRKNIDTNKKEKK